MAGWLQEQTRRHHVETAAWSTHHPGPAGLHTEDQRQPYRGKQAHGAPGLSSPRVRIKKHSYKGTKACLKGRKLGLFVNFG
jgi:hypothetical protein